MLGYTDTGVDKIVLSNFPVVSVDHEYIRTLSRNSKLKCTIRQSMPNKDGEFYIKICDNDAFGELVVGCNRYGRRYCRYSYLTLTPTHVFGDNMKNLTVEDYNDYLDYLMADIAVNYRIVLERRCVIINKMEINCNIKLDAPYAQYARAIKLLMSFCTKGLRYENTCNDHSQKGATTYMRSNKTWAIVMYNKTQQMAAKRNKGRKPDTEPEAEEDTSDFLRIELRLHTADKIKKVLGSNYWEDLDDQKIKDGYRKLIAEQWAKAYIKWRMGRCRELQELIQSYRATYNRDWHYVIMDYIHNRAEEDDVPFILDVEQIKEAYRELQDDHRNRSRTCNMLERLGAPNDLYHRNDCAKAEGILVCLAASLSDAGENA